MTRANVPVHAIRGRINSWLLGKLDAYMDRKLGRLKRELFSDLPAEFVELGAGTGANLRYYPRGARVLALEPSPYMRKRLMARADALGVEVEARGLVGESIDLPSGSVDAVVSTLVLCTVRDPAAVLAEVRRILRPGGRFLCLEHVAAPHASFIGWVQRFLKRPWHWFFEGCHTDRDLESVLREAGFSELHVEHVRVATAFLPLIPEIRAKAVR